MYANAIRALFLNENIDFSYYNNIPFVTGEVFILYCEHNTTSSYLCLVFFIPFSRPFTRRWQKKRNISLFYPCLTLFSSAKKFELHFEFLRFLKRTFGTPCKRKWGDFSFALFCHAENDIKSEIVVMCIYISLYYIQHMCRYVRVCTMRKSIYDRLERKQFQRSHGDKHIRTEFT